jgi:hypothetical protein
MEFLRSFRWDNPAGCKIIPDLHKKPIHSGFQFFGTLFEAALHLVCILSPLQYQVHLFPGQIESVNQVEDLNLLFQDSGFSPGPIRGGEKMKGKMENNNQPRYFPGQKLIFVFHFNLLFLDKRRRKSFVKNNPGRNQMKKGFRL